MSIGRSPLKFGILRLLLVPVAFAAVFGPIAWSRATDPFIVHVPLATSAFWGSLAAIALAEAIRRSGSRRELAAVAVGFATGTLVGWLLFIPCMEPLGLLIGPYTGLLAFYGLRPAGIVRTRPDARATMVSNQSNPADSLLCVLNPLE